MHHIASTNSSRQAALISVAVASAALVACSSTSMSPHTHIFTQDGLPAAVQVPEGHKVAMVTTTEGGKITYECRASKDSAGSHEWVFVGPVATLVDRSGSAVGRYFGPPATWALNDGSAITGAQLAVASAGAGAIPLQLVKANPATGQGSLTGVTHVQRVATQGGVAPSEPCGVGNQGARQVVSYKSDYIFWKLR